MSEKVSIIIVHHDEPDFLNIYLQSVRACSLNNDYEIIITDNRSVTQKSLDFLNSISSEKDIKIIRVQNNEGYTKGLLRGLQYVSNDSGYLVFSHSDNVVLNKNWIDYLIGTEVDYPKCGGIAIGPLMTYTGTNGKSQNGPHYNFLFTKKEIFDGIGGFYYKNCNNVGLILGYQHQLESYGKSMMMVSPVSFIHHYNSGKVSQEEKNEDIKIFNQTTVDRLKNIM
jgi:hypothetical protein